MTPNPSETAKPTASARAEAAGIEAVYAIDPAAVIIPVGEHCVLQRLGAPQNAVVADAGAALAFLNSFTPPAALAEARRRFSASSENRKRDDRAFDRLLQAAHAVDALREIDGEAPDDSLDTRQVKTLLTAIGLVAEDLAGDLAAMGDAADRFAREGTGETPPALLRQALGALTGLAVALASKRKVYVDEQMRRLGTKLPRLHLGAGGHNLEGWYNIDVGPAELALNLRWTLPFADNAIEYVFLAHLFEHLYKRRDAPQLLAEIRRVLKPDGVVRIIVPDAETYMRAYVERDEKFFEMQRQVWFTWAPKARTHLEAILGYLGAPEFPGHAAQHKYAYDFATLKLLLEDAGFRAIERSGYMASGHADLRVDDASFVAGANVDGRYASLFVEARK